MTGDADRRMTTIDSLINGIIEREGGYVDAASDKGHATKFGVTAATLGAWRGYGRAATREEVRHLSVTEAREIYRDRYVGRYLDVPEPLRTLLVDFAVTSWHDDATKALQSALTAQGHYDGPIDGILGAKTKAGVAVADPRRLFVDALDYRRRYYQGLARDSYVRQFLKANPTTQLHNADGWENRCWEFVRHLI